MKTLMVEYDQTFITYSTDIKITADCNDIAFQNIGDCDVIINEMLFMPGYLTLPGGISFINVQRFSGNLFEIDRTQYTIKFRPTKGSVLPQICVVRKTYKDNNRVNDLIARIGNYQKK